jgi:hypothetical protein
VVRFVEERPLVNHPIVQTVFSFSHIEGISLGTSEQVDEIAEGVKLQAWIG